MNSSQESPKQAPYLLFMLVASLVALALLGVDTFATLEPSGRSILQLADVLLCGLFFVDFLVSLYRAENKVQYMITWGWLDLVSSVPVLDSLRWGRAARMIRIIRLLRGVRSARILIQFILKQRTQSGVMAAAMIVLLMLTLGSISILHVEQPLGEQANIRTAEDALWWSVTTITTVGYGDKYPVSSEGRMIAAALMLSGVGLFGTLSGLLASWFLAPAETKTAEDFEILQAEIKELRELLQAMRKEKA